MPELTIYQLVCKAYFRRELSAEEIAEHLYDALMEYQHKTHRGYFQFRTPIDAVYAIIECEEASIKMARNFEPEKL